MGASKEHHFTVVTHRWRERARTAEATLDLVHGYLRAARVEGLSEHGRRLLVTRALDIIEEGRDR